MLGTAEFSSGRHSWTVRGAQWMWAVAGIALREIDRRSVVGTKDTARVFGRTGNTTGGSAEAFRKQVPGLTDESVLTLTLDCEAGTFAVAVDGEDKPELAFTEGIAGKIWLPVAGLNYSQSSVTIIH